METYLLELALKLNITLTNEQISQFMTYKNILQEWNEFMNLTAIVEDEEIILKHFIDSLTISNLIPQNASVIDVGTGAGFPGIALKIARPDLKVTLLDSLNKRIKFLEEVIRQCQLDDIQAIHGRAEDVGQDENYREKFDIAVARAVANLSTLSEFCIPFIKVGGKFIAMKGNQTKEIDEAQSAIITLGGKIDSIHAITLPQSDISRTIIVIQKEKNTSKKYPRRAGKPLENPL